MSWTPETDELVPLPEALIADAIYALYEDKRTPPRGYLGISQLGHPCDRHLWYQLRWAAPDNFDGRMLRLFDTGHREEERIICELKRIGMSIESVGMNGKQISVQSWSGFVVGHLDGIVTSGVPGAPRTPHLLEIKTHNRKSFDRLKLLGMRASQPKHYVQMQVYMYLIWVAKEVKRGLYVAVCKDNDEIYTERVHLDADFAKRQVNRGEQIVASLKAPPRIEEANPVTNPVCATCQFTAVCFEKTMPAKNCRTCHWFEFHKPSNQCAEDRTKKYDLTDWQERCGCDHHLPILNM